MATLVPRDFDLAALPKSERTVIDALLAGLDELWWLIPNVRFRRSRHDREIDLIIASRRHGGVVVEVKGGTLSMVEGQWLQYDRPIRSPIDQVLAAKHDLVGVLKDGGVDMAGIFLRHVVALPDVARLPAGGFGIEAPDSDIWCAADLKEPLAAIGRLSTERRPIPESRFTAFLQALKPTVVIEFDRAGERQSDVRRLDDSTRTRLEALAGLDAGTRMLVTGGAGTGKSWLVAEWARRATARGERTVVVCFNRPIADQLREAIDDGAVTVSTYHDLVVRLLEPMGWSVPTAPTAEFWEHEPTRALMERVTEVRERFDTVIIDEGQDIRSEWRESLEQLLDTDGAQRLLMVADPAQAIYDAGWRVPDVPRAQLDVNLRNTVSIGRVVERLGGAPPMTTSPVGAPVCSLVAGGMKEVRKRVRDEVVRLTVGEGLRPDEIAVLTTRSAPRDELFALPPDGVTLVRWESHGPGATLCETVHRTKGLEWPAVILVDLTDGAPDERLLYIGTSRARTHLTLVGPRPLAGACGVDPSPTDQVAATASDMQRLPRAGNGLP